MNRVNTLEDSNGELCSDEEGISNILVDYYQQLFTSSNSSMIDEVVAHCLGTFLYT